MSKFTGEIEKMSYAIGVNMGEYVKNMPLQLDSKLVMAGLQDLLTAEPAMPPDEYRAAMELCQQKMQAAGNEKMQAVAEANTAEGAAFLAENAKKASVKCTDSGLQYCVVSEGTGAKPQATDQVRVHYTGTLLDGTEFDSSVRRGEPAEFALNQVIAGWTEGLQLMNAGSKYRFFIPAELGYGQRGAGASIGPNATLIFDVELLAVL